MTATIRHKRGDTLAWDAIWWADAARTSRLDLTGWNVTVRARHESGVMQDMTVTIGDALQGEIAVGLDAVTSSTMPTGTWRVDIQRADGNGVTRSTRTFNLVVEEDITP